MTAFLSLAALLLLATVLVLTLPLLRRAGPSANRDAKDVALYRQQLAELDRDRERGVIGPAEAEGAKAEIARRLIRAAERADRAEAAAPAPRRATAIAAAGAVLTLPAIAVLAYLAGGAPGMPDLPFAARGLSPDLASAGGPPQRLRQAEAEIQFARPAPPPPTTGEAAEFAALIERLETVVADRPQDPQGLMLLANGYMRLGRPADAWPVFERLIALPDTDATAELWAGKADAMVQAAGGYVSAEALAAVDAALGRDPRHPLARYLKGIAQAQAGAVGDALATWLALRDETAADAPWRGTLDRLIAEATALQQGMPPPAGAPGPSAEQMQAAAEMSPEEQRAMIAGMVARLESRLAAEGGTPEEWLRLITAHARMGDLGAAREAYARGAKALGAEGGAGFLREQALLLGVLDE